MYRSGNPALSDSTFEGNHAKPLWDVDHTKMTIEGTTEKTAFLLFITAFTALATAFSMPESAPLIFLGAIGGFILALVIIFSNSCNPILICLYAAFEGLFIGGITWIYEIGLDIPGIGAAAALITFLILFAMLTVYRLGLIKWDQNMQIAVTSALFAIVAIYLFTFIGYFFGFEIPYIHGTGPIGIAFSLFVVLIAALCLAADFDFIERGVLSGSPKKLEWRAAFGLMVTLIWLYLEILKLLAKIALSKR
mgnify:CR=1 FL=1|jgi:uncharacterized YccA/Bax inhibitor family protein